MAQAAASEMERKIQEALKQVEQAMQRMEKDRLSDFATWSDLDALKRNLRFAQEDLLKRRDQAVSPEEMAKLDDEIASELERMSLLAEEIGACLRHAVDRVISSVDRELVRKAPFGIETGRRRHPGQRQRRDRIQRREPRRGGQPPAAARQPPGARGR